ncbi:MAG: ABC transporter ATP-binding protein [Actinobacteria bacterium]|nr:ABC transporter ATP-binding protein [Actinomycetota bacterium]
MSLELRGITKTFGSLTANDSINLRVETGQIHAILGENGAGKSTLMNIVYGLLNADSGEILVDEKLVDISEPIDALSAGIGMVHQHFMLIPVFTVAENIILGHEKSSKFGVIDIDAARLAIRKVSKDFGFEVDPDAIVESLPVGIQQKVEIIRALIYEAKVLILDEPTAVLTPQETDELLKTMRELKAKGTSIIFITHKLREVREVADQITIIRRGKVVAAVSPTTSEGELASMMVGRAVDLAPVKHKHQIGEPILVATNLTVRDAMGTAIVKSVNFHVNAGEVLAIAGVQGNGQSELARALINLESHIEGSIKLAGAEIRGSSIYDSLHSGIAFIPESRELDGLVGSFSIAENLILDLHDQQPYAKGINLSASTVLSEAEKRVTEFDIRLQSVSDAVSTLSGGNKQKVVIARELSRPVKVLVASQPTRGLDVGSIEFVHERILAERDQGRGVILFSTELDEVMALADRIAVMYRGEILEIVDSGVTRGELGLLMAGVVTKKASA